MKIIRKRNFSKLAVARLNINSKRNKFKALIQNVSGELDLLMFSETKIDDSFLESKFFIKGFSDPFCRIEIFIGEVSYCMLETTHLLRFYHQSQYHLNAFSLTLICFSESG